MYQAANQDSFTQTIMQIGDAVSFQEDALKKQAATIIKARWDLTKQCNAEIERKKDQYNQMA